MFYRKNSLSIRIVRLKKRRFYYRKRPGLISSNAHNLKWYVSNNNDRAKTGETRWEEWTTSAPKKKKKKPVNWSTYKWNSSENQIERDRKSIKWILSVFFPLDRTLSDQCKIENQLEDFGNGQSNIWEKAYFLFWLLLSFLKFKQLESFVIH